MRNSCFLDRFPAMHLPLNCQLLIGYHEYRKRAFNSLKAKRKPSALQPGLVDPLMVAWVTGVHGDLSPLNWTSVTGWLFFATGDFFKLTFLSVFKKWPWTWGRKVPSLRYTSREVVRGNSDAYLTKGEQSTCDKNVMFSLRAITRNQRPDASRSHISINLWSRPPRIQQCEVIYFYELKWILNSWSLCIAVALYRGN